MNMDTPKLFIFQQIDEYIVLTSEAVAFVAILQLLTWLINEFHIIVWIVRASEEISQHIV